MTTLYDAEPDPAEVAKLVAERDVMPAKGMTVEWRVPVPADVVVEVDMKPENPIVRVEVYARVVYGDGSKSLMRILRDVPYAEWQTFRWITLPTTPVLSWGSALEPEAAGKLEPAK